MIEIKVNLFSQLKNYIQKIKKSIDMFVRTIKYIDTGNYLYNVMVYETIDTRNTQDIN